MKYKRDKNHNGENVMRLYFTPFACSLAVRAALIEARLKAEFVQASSEIDTLPDGRRFHELNPLRQVPVLELDDGTLLREGAAILQYVADQAKPQPLWPNSGVMERYGLQQWLNFISTELHKFVFTPLLGLDAPDAMRRYVLDKAISRLELTSKHLADRDYLLGQFSVVDLNLAAVLNWCEQAKIDLTQWPILKTYRSRLRKDVSFAEAIQVELPLLQTA
jgi:glutathione S-transferase